MATALEKLTALRGLFNAPRVIAATAGKPIAAYVLPSTDAHQSEYLAEIDFRVKFLSNFSGSNAYVVVTNTEALLWTDGRYFVQADKQLSPEWTLMKQAVPGAVSPVEWLSDKLNSGDVIGFDPELMTVESGTSMTNKLKKLGITMVSVNGNLVDDFWKDRPQPNKNKLLILSDAETGEGIESKLGRIREELKKKKCSAGVFTILDDIMWTLNVRGSDISHNPLAYSYLFVTEKEAHFFIDTDKIDDEIRAHLGKVFIHNYGAALNWITEFHKEHKNDAGYRVFMPNVTNFAIGSIFGEDYSISDASPIQKAKAQKNATELEGMRQSNMRDSAALVEFLFWMDQELKAGKTYTEIQLAHKVDGIRATYEKFVDLSFPTISAGGDHAALPHYHAEGEDGQRQVGQDNVYLVDSGGQYRDGTTDVTRTVFVNAEKAPAEFIEHNTLVLKGHITLARTTFPDGIPGARTDSFARQALWQAGLDFGHGTGHGVGHFLNVHEGPIGIGYRQTGSEVHAGMVLTIEPGYYLPEKWGIRIENCYEVVPAVVPSGAKNFITFAPLTLAPIQTSIIKKDMLTKEEVEWLNMYHDRVVATTGEYLKKTGKEAAYNWMVEQCRHI